MNQLFRFAGIALATLALVAMGCAGGAWKRALKDDTPAAYYRFLRDHPDTEYKGEAEARLAFHKVKRRPTLAGFEKFNQDYPNHPLVVELRPLLEGKAFGVARGTGTAEAYLDFVEKFPDGPSAARAVGNAAYLEANGFGGRPDELAAFSEAHPESDYAAEASRTAQTAPLVRTTHFDRVGLRIEISNSTPEVRRLVQAFTEAAMKQYAAAGVKLVRMPEIRSERDDLPEAVLTIRHSEEWVKTEISAERVSRPGVDADTTVTLRVGNEGTPIWNRTFGIHVDPSQHLDKTSVLFGPSGGRFWGSFFVPVATWQSQGTVRSLVNLGKRSTAVDASGDRAVVLFQDGDFQLVDLADPAKPVVLAQHKRDRDFKEWSGVRIIGNRIAIFGDDGVEIVQFTADGSETITSLDRGAIGGVVAVQPLGDQILMAGNRGLIATKADGSAPTRLLRRPLLGLAVVGDTLILSDGTSVMISTAGMLKQGRVLSQLQLGNTFGPKRVRAFGDTAVVIGDSGALVLDLTNPEKPRTLSKLHKRQTGLIYDASEVGGRIFLLGERGLLVLDDKGRAVSEGVDVKARARVTAMGRHIVSIGEEQLQVVDATPFRLTTGVAAPR